MYCFWHSGRFLPGVPPPTNGAFTVEQVGRAAAHSVQGISHCLVLVGTQPGHESVVLGTQVQCLEAMADGDFRPWGKQWEPCCGGCWGGYVSCAEACDLK